MLTLLVLKGGKAPALFESALLSVRTANSTSITFGRTKRTVGSYYLRVDDHEFPPSVVYDATIIHMVDP